MAQESKTQRQAERRARLQDALRANLQRRKAQARERAAADPPAHKDTPATVADAPEQDGE